MTASTAARGYGSPHQRARRAALANLQDGDPCARCGRPMYREQQLHLDHSNDRTNYLGLSHQTCNIRAGRWRKHPPRTIKRAWQSRNW